MKKENRVELFCFKKLDCGVWDEFRVVVMKDKKDAAKHEYERQGYKVAVLWEGKP